MKISLKKLSIFLLALVGVSAVPGGILLLTDPSGRYLRMTPDLLIHSPFSDFTIPGLVLFLVIGLGSLLTAALLLFRRHTPREATLVVGELLMGWILFEMAFLQTIHGLQILYLIIAIILVGLGMRNRKEEAGV